MELFPPIKPFNTFSLKVSELHTIYVEQAGNQQGQPVVFLHGGPGGGIEPIYKQYFNPQKYHIILFDQRGCGNSTPFAELRENTTWDLVADIEKIRKKLEIDKWIVFGGSWGCTLALAYAQTHPDRVKGLILRGIFLLREKEIKWFYQQGANYIYPDAWENYLAPIPLEDRGDMVKAYYKRLTDDDSTIRLEAAKAWSLWEGSTSKLFQDLNLMNRTSAGTFADAFARIECHYFTNKGFFDNENQLLDGVDKIRHIPTVIVQGRYDVVCPMTTAWELHKAWQEAEFHVIQDAGHSMTELGIRAELIRATEAFSDI